ncbi:MAG: hypothetical protein A2W85_11395 [Bacteroidetes bacterium GWF2_41_31]|nr:MAG: hypothetical protein A2W85_11395 [Bacteroidetes bacterium GWF2_41_31]
MKKTVLPLLLLSLIFSLPFTSCVSKKKFSASEAKVNKLQGDSLKTHNLLNECNLQVKELKNEKASLQVDKASLENENAMGQDNLKMLADKSKLTIEDQAMRLKKLENIIQSQRDLMNNLKNSISEALVNYESDELSIYQKDGNIYVSLQEKLLFKSGSDVVDPKGKEALKTLAQVLNTTKDINVVIEGHTDNVPIKTNLFKDNWDLSTARATTIVRILTVDNGFDETRITASGRGQFHPVQTNETEAGRAGNRRTEVILSPKLEELYKLLNQ